MGIERENPNFRLIENLLTTLGVEAEPKVVAGYVDMLGEEELESQERLVWLDDKVGSSFELKNTMLAAAVYLWQKADRHVLAQHAFDRLMDDMSELNANSDSFVDEVDELLVL